MSSYQYGRCPGCREIKAVVRGRVHPHNQFAATNHRVRARMCTGSGQRPTTTPTSSVKGAKR